jgi:hydroxymethylbilane synthase
VPSRVVRVGTRRSPLALAQTEIVLRDLRRAWPRLTFEPVPLVTQGDVKPADGNADFTDRIDAALEAGEVDLAVHSTKDLPTRSSRKVRLVAFPRRADARDCLVLRSERSFRGLAPGARLGSSSPRRRAQILAWRSDLEVVEIHGNVGTRIAKLEGGDLDGVILAVAGLRRLGWGDRITEILPLPRMVPAPGQGALAVAARAQDRTAARWAAPLDDLGTQRAVRAERALAASLGATCDTPLGAFGRTTGTRLRLRALILSPDGSVRVAGQVIGPSSDPEGLGRALARTLLDNGAGRLLPPPPGREAG